MTKERAMQIISELPHDFDIELLIERIIFMEKVDEGLQQIVDGKVVPHQEVINTVKSWGK